MAVLYLAAGLTGAVCFYIVPPALQNWIFALVGLSAVVAIVVGVRRNRPANAAAWHLMALGQFLFVAGDLVWTVFENVLGREAPFPSLADAAYLAGYAPLALGLMMIVGARRPGRDLWSLTDAAVIAIPAAVGSWIFVMAPLASDSESALGTAVTLAYPIADVILIAVAATLAFTAVTKNLSYRLIVASLLVLITADMLYIPGTLNGWYQTGSPLDAGWQASYVLWGTAALHPSMRMLTERTDASDPVKFSAGRLVVEGVAVVSIPVMFSIELLSGGSPHGLLVTFGAALTSLVIIGRKARLVRMLEKAALHDALTGLPNRRLLLDRLEQTFRRCARSDVPVGVVFLDLTGFKAVNDRFGHEAGDDALVAIGGRIQRHVRAGDTVARLGGDEFVVIAEGLNGQMADILVERLREAVAAPLQVRDSWVEISVDIGVAIEQSPTSGEDPTQFLATADHAMYAAKAAAREAEQETARRMERSTAPSPIVGSAT